MYCVAIGRATRSCHCVRVEYSGLDVVSSRFIGRNPVRARRDCGCGSAAGADAAGGAAAADVAPAATLAGAAGLAAGFPGTFTVDADGFSGRAG